MRRVVWFSFVLALLVALWLPAREVAQKLSSPNTDASTHTGGPSKPTAVAHYAVAGTAGTWQGRSVREPLAFESSSPDLSDYSRSTSVLPTRFGRLHVSPALRTIPLLI